MYAYISAIIQRIGLKPIRPTKAIADVVNGEENYMEELEVAQQPDDINVGQISSGSWQVSERAQPLNKRSFKIRSHAIAFGRAQAFSSGSNLYIEGPDGSGLIQTKESLTYPLTLA